MKLPKPCAQDPRFKVRNRCLPTESSRRCMRNRDGRDAPTTPGLGWSCWCATTVGGTVTSKPAASLASRSSRRTRVTWSWIFSTGATLLMTRARTTSRFSSGTLDLRGRRRATHLGTPSGPARSFDARRSHGTRPRWRARLDPPKRGMQIDLRSRRPRRTRGRRRVGRRPGTHAGTAGCPARSEPLTKSRRVHTHLDPSVFRRSFRRSSGSGPRVASTSWTASDAAGC